MTVQPAIPFGGVAGLRLLDSTFDRQFAAFSQGAVLTRETDDFVARAGSITSAEALVEDRQLLKVALGAFGLEDELPKRALIRRVLEEGTVAQDSLANRLVDPAWRRFAEAMGFGDFGGRLDRESVRQEIAENYRVRQFERAVGDADVDLRLALNFRREIGTIASGENADRFGWFQVIGSEPLRIVAFGALGLPESLGAIDLDNQVQRISARAEQVFGSSSPALFLEEANVEEAVERFLFRAQAAAGPSVTSPGVTALTLLQSSPLGPSSTAGLFASRL
ncbi:MAG: DUF1217 domain-containing protein [Pseudomonadota bacterium]